MSAASFRYKYISLVLSVFAIVIGRQHGYGFFMDLVRAIRVNFRVGGGCVIICIVI